MRPTVVVSVALATAVLALSACGSSGKSDDGSLSRDELVAQANAICRKHEALGRAVPAPNNIQDAKQAAAYFDQVAPILDRETQALAALKPDEDTKADFDLFIARQKVANTLVATIREKADAADPSGLEDLQRVGPVSQAVQAAARTLGARACSGAAGDR